MKTVTFMTTTAAGKEEEKRDFADDALDSEIDAEFLLWLCWKHGAGWYD